MRQVTKKGLITVAAAGGVLAMTSGTAFADSDAQGGSRGSPGVLSGNSVELPVNAPVNVCGNSASAVGVLNPSAGNGCANGDEHGGENGGENGGADAHAHGGTSDSPGVGSGNDVQVPVDLPVNVCGDSVNVAGLGSPATGDSCGNDGSGSAPGGPGGPGEPGGPDEPGDSGEPGVGTPSDPGGPHRPHDPPQGQTPGSPADPGGPGQSPSPSGPQPWDLPGNDDVVHASSQPEAPEAPEVPQVPEAPRAPEMRGASEAPGPPGTDAAAPAPAELAQTGAGAPVGVVAPLGAGLVIGGYVLYRRSRPGAARR